MVNLLYRVVRRSFNAEKARQRAILLQTMNIPEEQRPAAQYFRSEVVPAPENTENDN